MIRRMWEEEYEKCENLHLLHTLPILFVTSKIFVSFFYFKNSFSPLQIALILFIYTSYILQLMKIINKKNLKVKKFKIGKGKDYEEWYEKCKESSVLLPFKIFIFFFLILRIFFSF